MGRISPTLPAQATGETKELYNELEDEIGRVPNIFRYMGVSAATLKGYLSLSRCEDETSFSPELRELIALAIGEVNECGYCLAAHTAIAKYRGIEENDIIAARTGEARDKKTQAILRFVRSVVEHRGQIPTSEINALKAAGISDKELVELAMIIAANMFTNYFNHIIQPEIDFPEIPALNKQDAA